VRERGQVVRCGRVVFKCAGAFLFLKLPSDRKLAYPYARIVGDECEQRVVFADNGAGQFRDCRHGNGAYGGLWTENVVSGIARDLLADAMLRIEAADYPIVLHVHDELVCEVPLGFGSTEEFTRLMTRKPVWALELRRVHHHRSCDRLGCRVGRTPQGGSDGSGRIDQQHRLQRQRLRLQRRSDRADRSGRSSGR
jgi:hypothetical protein